LLVAVSYIFLTGYTSINAIVKAELFPVHIRALGVGLGYAAARGPAKSGVHRSDLGFWGA